MALRASEGSDDSGYQPQRLFISALDHLKTPLTQIINSLDSQDFNQILASTKAAQAMIEAFNNATNQTDLAFEPVSVKSVLYDVAHELNDFANSYDCQIIIDYTGRQVPIVANQKALKMALSCLGQEFISGSDNEGKREIILGAHTSTSGTLTGVFAENDILKADVFRRGRALHGQAKMPFAPALSGSGMGVFIADLLIANMSEGLQPVKLNNLRGLAANFTPSKQIALV